MFESAIDRVREANRGAIPFEDQIKKLKGIFTHIVDSKKMGADLLFMLTYMASITTSNVTRPEIFSYTAEREEYASAKAINKVNRFVKGWRYSYAEALQMVAEKVRNVMLRSMMNRYSNAIDSGVPDDDFLQTELTTIRSVYRSTFEQSAELLKKWGDAYIAMLLSSSLVAIIIMISVAIYAPDGIESALGTSYAIIIAVSVFGVGIMYSAVPDDPKTHNAGEYCSKEQGMIRRLERIIVPVALAGVLVLWIAGVNAGVIFLLFGLMLMPIGILGYIDDTNIIQRDEDFAGFIRSLGSIMGGKGITTTQALGEVDKKSLTHLMWFVNSVHHKLMLGLDEAKSWDKFIGQTGSNLISKYMHIFRDSIALGGNADDVGKIVGASMLEQVLLRQKRDMLVKGFVVLLIPMHGAMVGIFVFLFEILLTMSKAITGMMGHFSATQAALTGSTSTVGATSLATMNIFVNFPADIMTGYVVVIMFLLTLANTMAGRIVAGGDRYMYYFFASVLTVITGIVFLVAPVVVGMFFSLPTGLEGL